MMLIKQLSSVKTFKDVLQLQLSRSLAQRTRTTKPKPKIVGTSKLTESKTSDAKRAEVLSRTRVVTSEKECTEIVRSIMSCGQPVAVDMEGVQLSVIGLIQVKTEDGQIYLFRVGRNRKLLFEGGLRRLFEDQNILKVMHASAGDCGSIYKEGVRMWGLYDTSLAQRVIEFQKAGKSVMVPPISFNALCEEYGFPVNPLKESMQGQMWQKENSFLDLKDLPEDLVYYSACDVEPLLDLYHMTANLLAPDFLPIFNELCEQELIRCVDPELVKTRRAVRKREEYFSVFLSNIEDGSSKAPIYEVLANHEGNKRVLSSVPDKTALIILSNRNNSAIVYKSLNDKAILGKKFGPNASVRLLYPLRHYEIEAAELEAEKNRDRLKEENYILDNDKAKEIVQLLERVKCPVVMDFHAVGNNGVSIELFVGRYPTIKFDVNPETVVQFGIGDLIASKNVSKIVGDIDDEASLTLLRTCSSKDFRPNSFFDIASAFKLVEYILYGSSIFKTPTLTVKEIGQKLGIFSPSHLDRLLHIYLHLKNYLPQDLLNFLGAKSRIELDLGSNLFVSEAKEARKQLRLKYETHAVHVRARELKKSHHSWKKAESIFEESLKIFLSDNKLEYSLLIVMGDRAIVSLTYHAEAQVFISAINSERNFGGNFKAEASKVDIKTGNRDLPLTVNLLDLERQNLPNIDNLSQLGFFKLLGENFEAAPSFDQNLEDALFCERNEKTASSYGGKNARFDPQKKKLAFLDLKLLNEGL